MPGGFKEIIRILIPTNPRVAGFPLGYFGLRFGNKKSGPRPTSGKFQE
jgi:hypothetical protein